MTYGNWEEYRQMFDHIIIRQDKFLRGREADDIVRLLAEGIKEVDPNQSYEYIPKEVEALKHALSIATSVFVYHSPERCD